MIMEEARLADTTPPTVPGTPSVSQLSTGALRITFAGSADTESGVAYYNLYRRKQGGASWVAVFSLAHDGRGTDYIGDDTSTIIGEAYEYAASALDRRGNESALTTWSVSTTAVVTDAPPTPATISASATRSAVRIEWQAVQGAVAYRLDKSVDGGSTWLAAGGWPLDLGDRLYEEPIPAGVEPGTVQNWRYRVRAINVHGVPSASPSSAIAPTIAATWTYLPAIPTVSSEQSKRAVALRIAQQALLVDPDGWDIQISRDGNNWYKPAIGLTADDPSDTGSATAAAAWNSSGNTGALRTYDPYFRLDFLPIPLDGGLPKAAGQLYRFRVRAVGKSAGSGSWSTTTQASVFATLYADIAAAQIKAANLEDSAVIAAKIAAGAVVASKLGVTNLDVDGGANIIRLNAELVYSAATAQVGARSDAILLSSGPAAGKYAYNYFDLSSGRFRVGNTTNYLYYDGSGSLTLALTTFKVDAFKTQVKGTLKISSLGDIETDLTKPLILSADGAGKASIGVDAVSDILDLYSTGSYPLKIKSAHGYLLLGPANGGWCHYETDRPSHYFGQRITIGTGELSAYSTNPLKLITASAERLRIDANGNVAIGTTDPGLAKLRVCANQHVGAISWGGTGYAEGYSYTDSGGVGITNANPFSELLYFGNSDKSARFYTNGDLRFIIDSTGNIAIGTSDPIGYKLRVLGSVLLGETRTDYPLHVVKTSSYGTPPDVALEVGADNYSAVAANKPYKWHLGAFSGNGNATIGFPLALRAYINQNNGLNYEEKAVFFQDRVALRNNLEVAGGSYSVKASRTTGESTGWYVLYQLSSAYPALLSIKNDLNTKECFILLPGNTGWGFYGVSRADSAAPTEFRVVNGFVEYRHVAGYNTFVSAFFFGQSF